MHYAIATLCAILALFLGTGVFFALIIGVAIMFASSYVQYVYCTLVENTTNWRD